MDLSTNILVLLLLLTSIIIGLVFYYFIICLIFNCQSLNSDHYKLPIEGFIVPFKQLKEGKIVNFIKLFFTINNPYIYMIVSLIIASVLIVNTLKTKKISKQVNASDLYKKNEES